MFYYPNVLRRHSGCFSTIWLAATRGIRITRRELLNVNVKLTCMDILDYVTAQVPPPQANLPRPRFSLYLSSQLQYGVVVVYHRQCVFLLEEVQQTIDRLLRFKTHSQIDMVECDRMALDLPDNLNMIEASEGALDPFFGLMESHRLPSPFKPVTVSEEAGSQHSLVSSHFTTPDKQGFRSPPAAITLTEKEQLLTAAAEDFEGKDLPEVTAREINLLMGQSDEFLREELEAETMAVEVEGASCSGEQPKETKLGAEQALWLPDEAMEQPAGLLLAASIQEVTPAKVAMPTPTSGMSGKEGDGIKGSSSEGDAAPPPRKPGRGRKRQLVFADREVQISDTAMAEQIENPLTETLELPEVMPDSSAKRATVAQLFSAPCGSLLHADLQLLWKHSTSITVLPGYGEEDREEEEEDREITRRDTYNETGLQLSEEGSSVLDMILDLSKEDKSNLSDGIALSSRRSIMDEALLNMEPIEEEAIEIPKFQLDAEGKDILSCIFSSLQSFEEVTFSSLLPPEAGCSTAALTFLKLLELLSAGQVTVQQSEPYGEISITTAVLRTPA